MNTSNTGTKMPLNKTVAFQGIEGSFSHLAMQEYFANQASGQGQTNFKSIFTALTGKAAQYAIVPVENSLAGSVYDVYDLLLDFDFQVIGEHYLRVNHALLCTQDDQTKIRKVYSHPKALEQCQEYFNSNPDVEKVFYSDTASAAKFVSESKNPAYAAIASKESAKLYGLKILKENIEDNPFNFTRFLILATKAEGVDQANKCSIIFSVPHQPQSLFKALETLSDEQINISKIQSRPIHGKPFEYVFYIDFDFENNKLEFVQKQLDKFREKVSYFKMLGLYERSSAAK